MALTKKSQLFAVNKKTMHQMVWEIKEQSALVAEDDFDEGCGGLLERSQEVENIQTLKDMFSTYTSAGDNDEDPPNGDAPDDNGDDDPDDNEEEEEDPDDNEEEEKEDPEEEYPEEEDYPFSCGRRCNSDWDVRVCCEAKCAAKNTINQFSKCCMKLHTIRWGMQRCYDELRYNGTDDVSLDDISYIAQMYDERGTMTDAETEQLNDLFEDWCLVQGEEEEEEAEAEEEEEEDVYEDMFVWKFHKTRYYFERTLHCGIPLTDHMWDFVNKQLNHYFTSVIDSEAFQTDVNLLIQEAVPDAVPEAVADAVPEAVSDSDLEAVPASPVLCIRIQNST